MADLYNFPEIYDERFSERANKAYKSHYQRIFEGKEIHSILDCSFGTGCLTFCLAELGYQVSGSDLSSAMLGQARKKAEQKGLNVDLTQCDFRELGKAFDRTFDCVMSTGNALAHVTENDVRRTLREMDSLVNPGGYLYLDSRNWDVEVKNQQRFRWARPFIREDGVRVNYVQDWDFNPDGSITIHILHGYEKDGNIFESMDFDEHLHPFSVDVIRSELDKMGYQDFMLKPLPWFEDKPFEKIGWYCCIAQKRQ